MSSLRQIVLGCMLALVATVASAQAQRPVSTLMVMPFENRSKTAGAEWLSEACSEVLLQRMGEPGVSVISRDERVRTFDRAGVPVGVRPTRATIFRIAEELGVDYVVLGSYEVSGSNFSAAAQLLDVKGLKLHETATASGALPDFVRLQTGLAWDMLRAIPGATPVSRELFVQRAPAIRLDAFESFVRGVVTTSPSQKTHYFKEALRLNPGYAAAAFELGSTYYEEREYEQAIVWLAKVPKDNPATGEATFLLGMSEYNRGNLDKAYSAFNALLGRLPLTEVYNNLGVVDARRGHRTAAVEMFSKAVAADPSDADYRFNLGLALFKNGDNAGAAKQFREELQLRPGDSEAKTLLELISRGVSFSAMSGGAGMSGPRIPIERIKRNYEETSYRQVEMQLIKLNQKPVPK